MRTVEYLVIEGQPILVVPVFLRRRQMSNKPNVLPQNLGLIIRKAVLAIIAG